MWGKSIRFPSGADQKATDVSLSWNAMRSCSVAFILSTQKSDDNAMAVNCFFESPIQAEIIRDNIWCINANQDVGEFLFVDEKISWFRYSENSDYLNAVLSREPHLKEMKQPGLKHFCLLSSCGVVNIISSTFPTIAIYKPDRYEYDQ